MSDRPDELRRQLATLWQAARTGFDTMREVVYRSSQAGRLRFDIAMLHRERSQLLRELGERTCAYLDQVSADFPEELVQLHDRIRDVESRIKDSSVKVFDNAFGAPRGFEPEAAEDYGDEPGVVDAVVEERPRPAPAKQYASRKKRPSRKKGGSKDRD